MALRARFPSNPVTDVREFRTPSPLSEEDSPGPITPPHLHSPLSSASSTTSSASSASSTYSFPSLAPPSPSNFSKLSPQQQQQHQPQIYTPSPTLSALSFSPNAPTHTPSPKAAALHVHPALHGAALADALRSARSLPPHVLAEPATSPPILRATIRCTAHLPWEASVASATGPVSVGDVLARLRSFLDKRVSRQEYDAERRARRARIQAAFEARTAGDVGVREHGLHRVDFLEGREVLGLRPVQTSADVAFELLLSR